jgi:hypothetical protein
VSPPAATLRRRCIFQTRRRMHARASGQRSILMHSRSVAASALVPARRKERRVMAGPCLPHRRAASGRVSLTPVRPASSCGAAARSPSLRARRHPGRRRRRRHHRLRTAAPGRRASFDPRAWWRAVESQRRRTPRRTQRANRKLTALPGFVHRRGGGRARLDRLNALSGERRHKTGSGLLASAATASRHHRTVAIGSLQGVIQTASGRRMENG